MRRDLDYIKRLEKEVLHLNFSTIKPQTYMRLKQDIMQPPDPFLTETEINEYRKIQNYLSSILDSLKLAYIYNKPIKIRVSGDPTKASPYLGMAKKKLFHIRQLLFDSGNIEHSTDSYILPSAKVDSGILPCVDYLNIKGIGGKKEETYILLYYPYRRIYISTPDPPFFDIAYIPTIILMFKYNEETGDITSANPKYETESLHVGDTAISRKDAPIIFIANDYYPHIRSIFNYKKVLIPIPPDGEWLHNYSQIKLYTPSWWYGWVVYTSHSTVFQRNKRVKQYSVFPSKEFFQEIKELGGHYAESLGMIGTLWPNILLGINSVKYNGDIPEKWGTDGLVFTTKNLGGSRLGDVWAADFVSLSRTSTGRDEDRTVKEIKPLRREFSYDEERATDPNTGESVVKSWNSSIVRENLFLIANTTPYFSLETIQGSWEAFWETDERGKVFIAKEIDKRHSSINIPIINKSFEKNRSLQRNWVGGEHENIQSDASEEFTLRTYDCNDKGDYIMFYAIQKYESEVHKYYRSEGIYFTEHIDNAFSEYVLLSDKGSSELIARISESYDASGYWETRDIERSYTQIGEATFLDDISCQRTNDYTLYTYLLMRRPVGGSYKNSTFERIIYINGNKTVFHEISKDSKEFDVEVICEGGDFSNGSITSIVLAISPVNVIASKKITIPNSTDRIKERIIRWNPVPNATHYLIAGYSHLGYIPQQKNTIEVSLHEGLAPDLADLWTYKSAMKLLQEEQRGIKFSPIRVGIIKLGGRA